MADEELVHHHIPHPRGNYVLALPPRYSIFNKVLGHGGFGIVCSFFDAVTERNVAIKKFVRPFEHVLQARRGYREIALMRRIPPHPNIVKLIGLFTPAARIEEFQEFFIVQEELECDMAVAFLRNRINVNMQQLSFLMYQILCAVHHLHRLGIVHRDLKPSNIVLNSVDCRAKLIDFGLARHVEAHMSSYVFTRWYRAPEVILTQPHDAKADMWAVGCMFADMILKKVYLAGSDNFDQLVKLTSILGSVEPILPKDSPMRDFVLKMTKNAKQVLFEIQFPDCIFPPHQHLVGQFPSLTPKNARQLLSGLLCIDPKQRISSSEALEENFVQCWSREEETHANIEGFDYVEPGEDLSVEHWRLLMWNEIRDFNNNRRPDL